ncbi:MAG: hypothetical protein GF350_06455 [Chitinivibrionales bacterium]|nr:hypothetical protein [Chitinivibrionales bacterium]
MTICVASISGNSFILGASDRMLTAGDVQFEPPQPKIKQFTSSIALMIAGDIGIHSQVYQNVMLKVRDHIDKTPDIWLKVKDVVDMYSKEYFNLKLEKAEEKILFPLNLNKDTFLRRQNELSPSLVDNICRKLSNFELYGRDIGAIITGNDGDASVAIPHIYTVENGNVECKGDIGFAAIGAGCWHANSQFMFDGYTKNASIPQSLLSTYWAKKRAEVAPGVGSETDMFAIGPQLGTFTHVFPNVIQDIDNIYKKYLKKIENVEKQSIKDMEQYIEDLGKKAAQKQEESSGEENGKGERNNR